MSNSKLFSRLKSLNVSILTFCLLFVSASLSAQDKSAESIQYLKEKAAEIGIKDSDINDAVVSHVTKGAAGSFDVAYVQQTKNGISIHNKILNVVYNKAGEIVGHTGSFALNINRNNIASSPSLSPMDAFKTAAANIQLKSTAGVELISQDNNAERSGVLSKGEAAIEDITFKLVYQDMGKTGLMLAWEFVIYETSTLHWWQIRIDANTGKYLDKNDWVTSCNVDHSLTEGRGHVHGPSCEEAFVPTPLLANSYNVFAMPNESPSHGGRTNETTPWLAGSGSPFGWHDDNGAAGNEYTITRGNNVYASEDQNADNVPGFSPDGGGTLDFDFPINFANAPSTYSSAVITNLFYWNNIIHDVLYEYGFDEASGNFQENNYGNGGLGSDYVNADALDGSGTDNANFGTPPDGGNPRMQMYVWTQTSPNRTSDLDNGVIIHEYGHGVSNRLTGGPGAASCLGNQEQMGEGWSDYLGLMLTMKPGDLGPDPRGIGTYVLGQATTGTGIRQYPYSTNLGTNPHSYNNIAGVSIPHGVGSVWCAMLWEVTWALIDQYGFDSDIYNGTGGNNIALQLVLDGMKLQPCSPGFVDGRDAILLADQINNGGANQCLIWEAFAKRGLGIGADQGSSNSVTDGTEDFNTPCFCDPVPGPEGCTDPLACNYDPLATCNDFSCIQPGCTDPAACNYDPAAPCDDGSCIVGGATPTLTLTTDCWNGETSWEILDGGGVQVAFGSGYGSETTYNLDQCLIPDVCYTFIIYDTYGDGLGGVSAGGGCNIDGDYFMIDDLGNTLFTMGAANFGFQATHPFCLDGSPPPIPGCTDITACNYNALATINDGSCIYAPAGDECSNAVAITVDGGPIGGNTSVTCVDGPNPSCGGGLAIRDVWYSFLYTGGDIAIQTATGTLTDTRIAMFDACGGTQLGCNDDFGGLLSSRLEFDCTQLVVGTTYFIQAGGYNSGTGGFTIEVSSTPTSGCTNPAACNYDAAAICDDGTCSFNTGCTDPAACNYDVAAGCDDGSCISPLYYIPTVNTGLPILASCTDPGAPYVLADQPCVETLIANDPYCLNTEYDTICEDAYNLCVYGCIDPQWFLPDVINSAPAYFGCPSTGFTAAEYQDCVELIVANDPFCLDTAWDTLCQDAYDTCSGCTNAAACNYDPNASVDDGSCILPDGCTSATACNYNPTALCDDGSCIEPDGCTSATACNYNAAALCDDGSCIEPDGCTSATACNYNPAALCDDGSCNEPDGCTNPAACNFSPAALCDDGSCTFGTIWYEDLDGDTYGSAVTTTACTQPAGFVAITGDCDDTEALMYPGGPPTATGIDNDCSGTVDPDEANPCIGDFNADGERNVADLLLLLSNFGCNSACIADLNNDGPVNTGDMVLFLGFFGTPCP